MRYFDSLTHPTAGGAWLSSKQDSSISNLLGKMDSAGMDMACLVGIEGVTSNDEILTFAMNHPDRFVPIAGFNPIKSSNIVNDIADIKNQGFVGIKLHPRFNNYNPLDPRCIEAINIAGELGIVSFICTLFRQKQIRTCHTADIIDAIATTCKNSTIVLVHGGGTAMLDIFELVRMHPHLILDLAFSMLRYEGSSLDLDMRFVCKHLDQRVIFGSDFPESMPAEAISRIEELTHDLSDVARFGKIFVNKDVDRY